MNSLNCARKMIASVPRFNVARNITQIPSIYLPSQIIDIPSPSLNRSAQAADRLIFSWYDSAWNKTKNMILDNWDSAGLIKRRKPNDEYRKNAPASNVDRGDKKPSSSDELAKAKNKAQRHLAENWDAIRQANTKTNQTLVDSAKESATMTIDELSKSAKETAGKLVDETTKEMKLKIMETADDVKKMKSKIIEKGDVATKEIISKIREAADDVKELKSKIIEKGDEATKEINSKIRKTADDVKEINATIIKKADDLKEKISK